MCGLNTIVDDDYLSRRDKIKLMHNASKNRGPDGEGFWNNDVVSMSHNLLSITDQPNKSIQPWGDGDCRLIFNGEIYNYKELRKELKNNKWDTDCDTEVLYVGLKEEGLNFIKKLNGMYAFIWLNNNELYLVRDQSGVKPLYYYSLKDKIYCSSSITSLLEIGAPRKLHRKGFILYWHLGYVPGYLTLFKNIYKVCPNEIVKFDIKTKKIFKSFVSENIVKQDFNEEEFLDRISDTIHTSLSGYRDIGLFLSGGIDSSVICYELCKYYNKPKTFTTRFQCNNKIYNDDANVAKKLSKALGTEHNELLITSKDFIDAIPDCVKVLEEPRCNVSSPAYYLTNKYIAKHGIIVTLSGDGGDEIFTGYERHNKIIYGNINEWILMTNFRRKGIYKKHLDIISEYIKSWNNQRIPYKDPLNSFLSLECNAHLPEDFLIRNDRLGMNFGMEGRFPYTNRKFRNYVLGINKKDKIKKKIMFNSFRNILPDFIINKSKTGWKMPVNEWTLNVIESEYYRDIMKQKDFCDFIFTYSKTKNLAMLRRSKFFWNSFYFLAWVKEFNIKL